MVRKRAPNIKQRGKTIITPNKPRRPKLSSSAAATPRAAGWRETYATAAYRSTLTASPTGTDC